MTTWEYKFIVLDLDAKDDSLDNSEGELNRLGHDGWEVISLLSEFGKDRSWYLAILKRQQLRQGDYNGTRGIY